MAEAGERKETSKKQSDIPPNFVTLVQLQERWLKKKAEEEEEERKLKELQDKAERRREFQETKQQQKSEAILRNAESSSHRREIRRAPVSAQALGEGNEDDEGSKLGQGRKSKKRKKTARAKEKNEKAMQGTEPVVSVAERTVSESIPFRRSLVGKEVRMEYRPKMKISKGDEIENACVPSRMIRCGKRSVNLDEENCKVEIQEVKLAELSIEESKYGLETKDGVGDDGLYQPRRRSEVNPARHFASQTTYDDGKRRNGDAELSRSECQDRSADPHKRSSGRSRGRGDGGRSLRGKGDGGRGSRGRGDRGRGSRGGYNKVGVWVRREDVGSGGEVTVNGSGVQLT